MRTFALAVISTLAVLVSLHTEKANQRGQPVLNLPLFPAPIVRDHTPLTLALGTIGASVQDGYALFGVELHAKDGKEPLVNLNLPAGSHLGDGLSEIMAQVPGYEHEVVSVHMINIYPVGAKRDSTDVLNTPVARFDAKSADPTQILTNPSEFIPELASRLNPRRSTAGPRPSGYGGASSRSKVPTVSLQMNQTTVRQILNAASEAMEGFPPEYYPVGWAYLFQPDPTLPAGGKHSWSFVFSAPNNWKPQPQKTAKHS